MLNSFHFRTAVLAWILVAAASAPLPAAWFIRGDVNASGTVNLSDVVHLFRFLFLGDTAAAGCPDAADVDDDGKLTVTDGIYLLSYLFQGGPAPGPTIGGCWFDPTDDTLGCPAFETCKTVGVFLVGDRSGSMNSSGEWQCLQREVVRTITQLSDGDQFGLFFFDLSLVKYPASGMPADANSTMKAAAIGMVMSTATGHGTCPLPALLAALASATLSTAAAKEIVYLSDGGTNCPNGMNIDGAQILAEVRQANKQTVPIHAVAIGRAGTVDEVWMRKLAAQNGGSYVRIVR